MPKLDKYEEQLMRVMFELGESLADAPEEEVLQEAKRNHVNLLDEADEVGAILRAAAREYMQRQLRQSRQAYEDAVSKMQQARYELPPTTLGRKQLLSSVLTRRPDFESIVMTTQFRDFNDLTDDDVTSFLKQLIDLGLLDIPTEPTSK